MKYLFLAILRTCLITNLFAVEDIAFKHLSTKEGLSNGQVSYITKDSQGFMWFCTNSGLNRYDGYTFKVFVRNGKDPNSLIDNSVEHIQEDADGGLWVRTERMGYVYYDPGKESFHPAEQLLSKYGINKKPDILYVDKGRNIWCHTNSIGTYQYNIKSKKLLFYPVDKETSLSDRKLCYITEDQNGIIYLYENGLIECLDRNSGRIIFRNDYLTYTPGKAYSKYSMLVDSEGDYWIYTKNNTGLWTYYIKENTWEHSGTQKNSRYVLSNNNIGDIKEDLNGQLWIATDHGGINLINKKLQTIQYIINDPFNERSIAQNSLTCLYCDEIGIVWVGTYKRGISYYYESIFKFKTDHLTDLSHIENFTPDVNVIIEDKQANLWLGTNSSGLICMNRETKERKIFQYHPDKNSLSSNVIVSLLASNNGKIWAGTFQEGLNLFDGHIFTNYRHQSDNQNSLSNDNIWALKEGDNGLVWIGTLGDGLQSLDPHTGVITHYADEKSEFSRDIITSICIARDKNLLMSTADGITSFSPATGRFEKWRGNKRGTQSFSHQNINQIYEDSRGLLWLATQEGLDIYDRKKDAIVSIEKDLLLQNDIIYAVLEDNNKNMWITTTHGICNIIVSIDPKTGTYTYASYHYNEQDGLLSREFNVRSIIKTFRGEIIAGGIQGLSLFDPENIKYNYFTPQVVFTDMQLFNEAVRVDSVYDGNRILSKALNRSSSVKLQYSQNVFSVSFSSMNFILPEKSKYMYMLEGFNTDWLIADANKVTYTNLTQGKYTLKVKAINSDGFSNDEASELQIIILPPFWLSPIAYILYGLLIIGILLLARRQILRTERNKYQLIKLEHEAKQKHEIDDMKLRFFTNISHELRTPLTLIISPLENMIKTIEGKEQRQRLEMIHRNAIRLLNMVNQLLDFRKSDVKGHRLNSSQGDIVEFIRNISTSFTEYSENKSVHLTFFSAIKELSMIFDEDKIGKVIMNLLSNAFKFTPQGGRVDIYLNLLSNPQAGEKLEIKISDTGIGIKDEDKERVFERFYQVAHSDNHKISGSGVGLHLAKEFVTLHQGTIVVRDNVEQGCVFIVSLPVIRQQTRIDSQSKQEVIIKTHQLDETVVSGTIPEIEIKEVESTTDNRPVVLIVDDNEDFRQFMKDCLKTEYIVEESADGVQAWALIPTLQPDIIVSDIMMPKMDGIELCKLVKTDIRTSHISLILLTARSAEEQILEGLESGTDDYITKPFNVDILQLRIKKLLQLQQNRQAHFNGKMDINPSEITITSLDENLIQKAIQYVEDNISRSDLSVEELSNKLAMSRVHLYKKLLSITGKTPVEFIRIIRLKRAAQLLRESQQNVSEIAYQLGFNNPRYFSKYFKEEFGVLPSTYQGKEVDNK
ncbi:MAG: response regulator [Tannerellaceae bacterium]|jgi:signal transduction histidine kinase/ligand-binding sensor domain-containing protein/DNA-binding response OmpR family regulator|nr:response regulator [Tannerellaceae bacterium]